VVSPDAVLTVKNVARPLEVSERRVERSPLRRSSLSRQTKRVLFRDVVAYVDAHAR
jgi:hypothetical protein